MAKEEREIAGWITTFGNHIPIYTDDPNLSSYQEMWDKERQIEASNKEAQRLNEQSSGAGKYTVYRAGDLSGGGTGLVYFAMDKQTADSYGKSRTYKSQGKTYKTGKRETKQYDIAVRKPLVVKSDDDVNCAIKAYNELHSKQKPIEGAFDKKLIEYAKRDGYKITGANALQFYLDKANAEAIKSSQYDSIQYLTYRNGGHQLTQILIPAGSDILKRR